MRKHFTSWALLSLAFGGALTAQDPQPAQIDVAAQGESTFFDTVDARSAASNSSGWPPVSLAR